MINPFMTPTASSGSAAMPHLRAGFMPLHRSIGTPLFLVHDDGGAALDLVAPLRRPSTGNPTYRLSAAFGEPSATRQGQATCLLETVRRMQPRGPYRLAGWWGGGLLAYEMGLQLIGQDERVEFLGLLGAPPCCDDDVPQPTASLPVTLFVDEQQSGGGPIAGGWTAALPASQLRVVTVRAGPRAVEQALGHALATPAACSDVASAELSYRPVVTIQTGRRENAALFCIPGAGDSVTGFTSLGQALGSDWRLLGLQPRGVDGVLVPHSTVQAAAAMYLDAIEAAQPYGAVHLVGHSFGGWIAFEIACRLQAAGRPPASLTLIDSEVPGGENGPPQEFSALEVTQQFIESLELSAQRPLPVDQSALQAGDDAERLRQVHAAAVQVGLMSARTRPEAMLGSLRTFGTALRTSYVPSCPYTAPLRMVLVPQAGHNDQANRVQDQCTVDGWRRWAPLLSHWQGPGNHMTILQVPHVRELAQWWVDGLTDSRTRAAPVTSARGVLVR